MKSEEVDVAQIEIAPDKPAVFCLTCPSTLTPQMAEKIREAWNAAWCAAGSERPPAMLILDHGYEINSLTDDALKRLGLMRLITD